MKKVLTVLILFSAISLSASITTPEYLYSGYANVVSIDDINAVFVNPAALTKINMHDIYITFTSPFIFRSLALPLPFTEKYTAGLGFEDDGILQRFRFGLPIMNFSHFKAGMTFGMDREEPLTNGLRGFAFDTGFIIPFFQNDKNNFSMDLACSIRNLISLNDFETAKSETSFDLDTGLRTKLFVKDLFLNLGGNYHQSKLILTAGLEIILFSSMDLGICMKEDTVSMGTAIHLKNSALTFAWNVFPNSNDTWSLGYNFYLKPKILKKIQLPTPGNSTAACDLQRRQKAFLDKGIELYKIQEYEQARTNWNQCIQLGPNSDTAKEAKKYIDRVNTILNNLK